MIDPNSAKRVARVKLTLTKRTVEALEQLREPAQRVADRIDELTAISVPVPGSARAA